MAHVDTKCVHSKFVDFGTDRKRVCDLLIVSYYWSSIVILVLSCPVSKILELLYVESQFSVLHRGWLGGTTGSASDQRSEDSGFEAY